MTYFQIAEKVKITYPLAFAGVLVMTRVINPDSHDILDEKKRKVENELRQRFAGQDRKAIESLPQIMAYNEYYRRFKKTYHVLQQVESIALKGVSIPHRAALVEAMFMAEVQHMLLTAGHDLNAVQGSVSLNVANGDERYMLLRGQEQETKAGDMLMADEMGIISSIIYGPDQRTQINPHTTAAMFTVYAVPGITTGMVMAHLEAIRDNVLLIVPHASVDLLQVYS